jgi:serine O-acetyltransferase
MNCKVRSTLNEKQLADYVTRQLNQFFDDGKAIHNDDVQALLPQVMSRLEHCFTKISSKYFFDGRGAVFNHLHSDQYAMFLYLLCNTACKFKAPVELSAKLFLLNKSLHGIDAFYEIELPSVFLFVHPLGTVLGRGCYSDYLLVYQRCGIGSNHDIYPTLGPYTTLRPGSSILGECTIGRNNTIAAESLLLDRDLSNNSIYIGNPRDFMIRASTDTPTIWRK